ncbi:DUF5074 domain-containing protein [Pontibacter pamirensis]|uniref:DUF5074 domain-containing protein n=1 Tax=Pontibacter pamirensis TaxID=2562824 RepID=UPI00138953B1|nr:DUF5074 domain-containing protein [Pontibacter pamirensis]
MRNFNFSRSLFVAASLLTSTFAFTSCDNDSDAPSGAYAEDGVFVINEGGFNKSTASVSYYNSNTEQVQQQIFQNENNRLLGDVIQDMEIYNDRAFLVVNNSNKVEVVNAATFKSAGTIEGLSQPRYFVALNNEKGYVTEWLPANPDWSYNNGRVSVINLEDYTVIQTIDVGVKPEQLLIAEGKLYVTNSGGNTLTVINTANDVVEQNIPITFGPNSLVLGRDNALWVLSAGNKDWKLPESEFTAGALTKVNPSNSTITSTVSFPLTTASASKLVINGDRNKLYFSYNSGVHQFDIPTNTFNTTPLIDRSFYGLGVDPDNGYIYGGDSNSFDGDGTVHVYRPDGTKVSEFQAGIGPNGFVFN